MEAAFWAAAAVNAGADGQGPAGPDGGRGAAEDRMGGLAGACAGTAGAGGRMALVDTATSALEAGGAPEGRALRVNACQISCPPA